MEKPTWWKRLPIIRRIRYHVEIYRINRHYDQWASMGFIPWRASEDYETAKLILKDEL